MKTYISYGGGVNSTAMIIHLLNSARHFDEIVFADTEAENPETYEYMDYFESRYLVPKGYRLERITTKDMGIRDVNLLQFFQRYSFIPHRTVRICTVEFKIKPIMKYYEKPCVQLIGIDAGEAHRAKPSRNKEVTSEFPLLDAGITRKQCLEIIASEGLCLPRKSGCYFCPFARIAHYRELHKKHPELFEQIIELEQKHDERHNVDGKSNYILHQPMSRLAKRFETEMQFDDKQLELWDDPQDSMNCLCKFA